MTGLLFRDDAYLASCAAVVTAVEPRGVVLDRTVFYAAGGGQPSDAGWLERADGAAFPVIAATYADASRIGILHDLPADHGLLVGDAVTARLDWAPRHRRMRLHTALHLLCAVVPYPVTGGAVGEGEARLDFASGDDPLDRAAITARLAALVGADAAVSASWITDEEMDRRPELVRTLRVAPPRGGGRVRLVSIEGIDLQPCGGTHVARTGEVGAVAVTGVESKGRMNRRVRIALG